MLKRLLSLFAMILCIAACKNNHQLTVTTYAGNGSPGAVNGNLKDASFSNPMGLAIDSSGNIYVADSRNNLIRKITADGTVSTLAGSGKVGSADGNGISASFFFPTAVAVDAKGVVYVADTHNNLVRKITPDGTVTTIAGRAVAIVGGQKDTTVKFDNPSGIVVDKTGNVYVADWAGDVIRKISPGGLVSTFAGSGKRGAANGPAASASFFLPAGIAADGQGNFYVADSYNNMIRKITHAGAVSTLVAGKVVLQQGRSKRDTSVLSHPYGITVDKAGNVYVADKGNNKIRKITPNGKMTTYAGSGKTGLTDGDVHASSFYNPYGVAIDKLGDIFVADYQNNVIRKITN